MKTGCLLACFFLLLPSLSVASVKHKTFGLSRAVVAETSNSVILIGDGSGDIGKLCAPLVSDVNDGSTVCSCAISFRGADGAQQVFENRTIDRGPDLLRCPIGELPLNAVSKVSVWIRHIPSDVVSNRVSIRTHAN